jgi:hypothetical protein
MTNQATITDLSIEELRSWAEGQGNLGIAVLFLRAYGRDQLTDQLIAQARKVHARQVLDGRITPAPRTERITLRHPPTIPSERLVCTNSIVGVSVEDETISAPARKRTNPWTGIYTMEHEDGHTTFRIKVQPSDAKFAPGATVIEVLVGQDNENDYTSFGFLRDGRLFPFKGFRSHLDLLDHANAFLTDPDATLVSKSCARCGRTLTTPESVLAGFGPECAKKGLR